VDLSRFIRTLYGNPSATIADFYASQGGRWTEAAVQDLIDHRGLRQWGPVFDMVKMYDYFSAQYTPTNLGKPSGADDHYGAARY
jgi:hypothetical protein